MNSEPRITAAAEAIHDYRHPSMLTDAGLAERALAAADEASAPVVERLSQSLRALVDACSAHSAVVTTSSGTEPPVNFRYVDEEAVDAARAVLAESNQPQEPK